MKVLLDKEKKFFATSEVEADSIVEKIKEETDGTLIKRQIDTKHHKDYGDYFEVTVKEQFTTSRDVLEEGV